jgi:glucose-1-phosphate thymidylyltransferase
MWGIVPAAGRGTRIQPLAFSKELLPVGGRLDGGVERPCAVAEYLVERMILAGVDKICFVISAEKSDILEYFGDSYGGAQIVYVVQPQARGLCDSVFRACCVVDEYESVIVGLPDTIWFPSTALAQLPDATLSFLLFPVAQPELFDAVLTEGDRVREIRVKQTAPGTKWIWGAFRMSAAGLRALHSLWMNRDCGDEYFGTLVNAYLANGGEATAVRAGEAYVDVGTINGYRAAISLVSQIQNGIRQSQFEGGPQTWPARFSRESRPANGVTS